MKTVQAPSEAKPDKRDIVFDLLSHNPKDAGSNPAPATSRHRDAVLTMTQGK
jgi:hypothetical protein